MAALELQINCVQTVVNIFELGGIGRTLLHGRKAAPTRLKILFKSETGLLLLLSDFIG